MKRSSSRIILRGARWLSLPGAIALLGAAAAIGAETGDIDGDGRVTIADAVRFLDGLPAAPGALAGLEADPCFGWNDSLTLPGALLLEAARRSVPGSLPNWWTRVWQGESQEDPLPGDERVLVRFMPAAAAGGASDRLELRIAIESSVTLRAFLLVLESDGDVLQPAFDPGPSRRRWNTESWTRLSPADGNGFRHASGDIPVDVNPAVSLVTGGKYAISYLSGGIAGGAPVAPGTREILVEARLPRNTPAGRYGIRLLRGSQALLEGGEIISPAPAGPGEFLVESDVAAGWGGVPPLRIDAAGRRVLGAIEFRIAGADGSAPPPGEPAASGFPGDEVAVRVQMRTEVPLNRVHYRIEWPFQKLLCAKEIAGSSAGVIFTNPEDGSPYVARDCTGGATAVRCYTEGAFGKPPAQEATFVLAGASTCGIENEYPERPLEYFKPLGEWIDLTEVRLRIRPEARGGEDIPLAFLPADPRDPFHILNDMPRAEFIPYSGSHLCPREFQTGEVNWRYDVHLEDSFVRVLGEAPGSDPDPPPAGIRVAIGEAAARRGDVAEIPILAAADLEPHFLQIALEIDPAAVEIDTFEVEILSFASGERALRDVRRGENYSFIECIDRNGDGLPDQQCTYGQPVFIDFRHTEERFVLLGILPGRLTLDAPAYPGPSLRRIGRLRAWVREDFEGFETTIRPAAVFWNSGALIHEARTGGFYALAKGEPYEFAPAAGASPGRIAIGGKSFIRGDATASGAVDVSDAIAALGFLFLGEQEVACEDAADADDNGYLEITDPVRILGALFLGQGSIPPPAPGCGRDPTEDSLSCERGCSGP